MKKLMNKSTKFYALIMIIASIVLLASVGMLVTSSVLAKKTTEMTGAEGFASGNMPEGFDAENMPEGFDSESMPELPEGMDASDMPQNAAAGNAYSSADGENTEADSGTDNASDTADSENTEETSDANNAAGTADSEISTDNTDDSRPEMTGDSDGSGMPQMPGSGEESDSTDGSTMPQMPTDGSLSENKSGFISSAVFRIIMIILIVLAAAADVYAAIGLVKNGKRKKSVPELPDNGANQGSMSEEGDYPENGMTVGENGSNNITSGSGSGSKGKTGNNQQEAYDPVAERLKKRKKTRIRLIILAAVIVIAVVVIQILSRKNSEGQSVKVEESVTQATVEDGTLSKTLKSSGIIASAAETDISIPGNIEVTEYFVSDGDVVEEGDIIASVDKNSVLGAIADVEELISAVDEKMMDVKDESISSVISAPYDVKVAAVYAAAGEDVTDVMYANGSLMLLSLDGLYAVDVDYSGSCKVGDEVSVLDSSGSTHTGNISEVKKAGITVTVDMDECSLGDEVEVSLSDGTSLGKGNLYINSELEVTGFSGTVGSVSVSTGSEVSSGDTLMTLEDTDYTAEYQSLLSKRLELVDQYNELVKIAATGFVTASETGTISGVDSSLVSSSGSKADENSTLQASSAETSDETCVASKTVCSSAESASVSASQKTLMSTSSGGRKLMTSASSKSVTGNTAVSSQAAAVSSGSTSKMMTVSSENNVSVMTAETTEINNQEQQGSGQQEGERENPGESGQEEEPGSNPEEEDSEALTEARKLIDADERALVIGTGSTSKTVQVIWIGSDGTIKTSGLPSELIVELISDEKAVDVEALKVDDSGNWTYTWSNLSDSAELSIKVVENTLDGYTTATSRIGSVTLLVNVEKASGNGSQNIPDGNNNGNTGGNNSGSSGATSSDESGFSNSNGTIVSQNGSYGFTSSTDDISELATETEEESTFSMSETVLCQLTPNDKVSIDITVDELDIGSVSAGQACVITLDAISGQSFEGTVSHKDPTGDNDGGNTKYTVTVTLDKTENMLLGMNASVSIELETVEGIPVVPEEALYEIDGKTCVYTSYDKKNDELGDPVEVETGLSDGINAEISSGLEEGDTYYYRYGSSIEYVF